MQKNRSGFQFPKQISQNKKSRFESPMLLWRILQCQSEVRNGDVKILKNPFLRTFKENEQEFSELSENLIKNIRELLTKTSRHRLQNFTSFIMKVSSQYRKELINIQSPGRQLSFDILYQIIQLLSLNPDEQTAESVIRRMGKHEPLCSLNDVDRELVFRNYRVYLFLSKRILKYKSLRSALEDRDQLLFEASQRHKEVMVYFIESMFRTFIGQILLSRKFKCDTLIVEWLREYGFEPDHMVRVAGYIPYDCSFLHFRFKYREAIKSLNQYKPSGKEPEDSDVYLLRSLSNFYTSWLSKTSVQIPA